MRETRHAPFDRMPVHRHAEAYAALVLDGDYEESSPDGRFRCTTGGLMVHPAWHAHADEFGAYGAVVLNLPVPDPDGLISACVSDVAAIERLARQSPARAGLAALEEAQPCPPLAPAPWLGRLTCLLARDTDMSIAELARSCGVTPEHASRACKRWFGLGPAALRRERRLRYAIGLLDAGASPCEAAAEAGFSDQPHLTRLLKRATGRTPGAFTRR